MTKRRKLKEQKKTESKGDILVKKIPLRLTDKEKQLVDALRMETARLWNDILDLHWWLYDVCKVWTSASEKKQWYNAQTHRLHSQTIQAIIEFHEETCERTREQREKGNKQWRYPWKYKKYFSVRYKKSAISQKDKTIVLSNGRNQSSLTVPLPKHIPFETIKNAEIVWHKNQYWLHLGVEEAKQEKVSGKNKAACDLGMIHAAALSNGKNHLIVTGKALPALTQYRNKRLQEFSRLIDRKKKGSNSRYKLILRKRRFLEKMERKIEYQEHAISKMVEAWCVENQINLLYIGTPEGVQRNTKKQRKARKETRRKLSSWSFGRLTSKIKYKLKLRGIQVEIVEESYTSGTCPSCGKFRKQQNRNFYCSCGAKGHRDVVGAVNILDKSLNGELTKNRPVPQWKDTKYRRVNLVPIAKSKKYELEVA